MSKYLYLYIIFLSQLSYSQDTLVNKINEIAKIIYIDNSLHLGLPDNAKFISNNENSYQLINVDSIDKSAIENKLTKPKFEYNEDYKYVFYNREFISSYVVKLSDSLYSFSFDLNYPLGLIDGKKIILPISFEEKIRKKKVINLYVKCFLRMDLEGNPIQQREKIIPIFIETKRKKFRINYSPLMSGGYMDSPAYSNYALQDCVDSRIKNEFTSKLKNLIVTELQQGQISATTYSDISIPEDEIWFKRFRKPSSILGNPRFEKSTYILRTKINSHDNPNGVNLYLTHYLLVAVGLNGKYGEPSDSESFLYKQKINKIINSMIKTVCLELNLVWDSNKNICKCN